MTPVTDPDLLAQLNGSGPQPVTDPALLAQLNGEQQQPEPSLLHNIGVGARAIGQGIASIPTAWADLQDMPYKASDYLVGIPHKTPSQQLAELLDKVIKPESSGERLSSDVLSGTAAAATGGLPKTIGAKAIQLLSGAAAGGAGGVVNESGGGQGSQLAAALAAGLIPGGIASGAKQVGRIADSALLPGGATRSAIRVTSNIADDPAAIQAALSQAKPGETAAQAAIPAGSAEFSALMDLAEKNAPSKYLSAQLAKQAEQRSQLANLAAGSNQEYSSATQKALKGALNADIGPKMNAELQTAGIAGKLLPELQGKADTLAGAAANKVEDVRRMEDLANRAKNAQVEGQLASQPLGTEPIGMPRLSGRYGYIPTDLPAVAKKAGETAADQSLVLGDAARFAQMQADSLAQAGLKPIDTSKIVDSLQAKLKDPSIGPNDITANVLSHVADKIKTWTENNGGVIDPAALHEIRKSAVNDKVQQLMGGAKPSAIKERAASILSDVKPLIDDAIESAGGTGWKNALDEYSQGMRVIDRTKMGAKALELFDKSPDKLSSLAAGNEPKMVEKVFGPGSISLAKEMQGAEAPIVNVGNAIARDKQLKQLASAGQSKVNNVYNLEQTPLTIPNALYRPIMIANALLKKAEGYGSQRVTDELSRLGLPENVKEYADRLANSSKTNKAQRLAEILRASMGGAIAQQQGQSQ